jgi:hypothetical protein
MAEEDEFEWPDYLPARSRDAWACVLWTLHDEGPITDHSGSATKRLAEALERRNGPYRAMEREPGLSDLLRTMRKRAPHLIERSGNDTQTHSWALRPAVTLPPNPYVAAPPAPPERVEAVELTPASPNGQVAAADALAAVASFVDSALAMAGVTHHEYDADERLAEALAENRRLHELVDAQETQLMERRKENEVLRRALARRDVAAKRRD